MNRRDFTKLLAMTSIACAIAHDTSHAVNKGKRRRVVVIGAGLSGLAAARELQRNAAEVIVLEARNRIGGRIHTSTRWKAMPLDMGASWIHGQKGNPITALADAAGAARVETFYDRAQIYRGNGKPFSAHDYSRLKGISKSISTALRGAKNETQDRSILKALEPLMTKYRSNKEDMELVQYILRTEYEQEYAGSVESLSAHWFDDDKSFDGTDALFLKGFSVITDYLAAGLETMLSQTVKAITWSDTGVRVETENETFIADHAVITLPLGVLKTDSVSFDPTLPDEKLQAISKLGMGVLNKCYLRFDHVFWARDVDWLGLACMERAEWHEWVSFQRAAGMPVLLGFTAGNKAREIESWPDERILESAMHRLRTMFGEKIPDPIDYQISRWSSDPYARGAYSYNALGVDPEMRDALMKPISNRLFFAGEATSRYYFGTTHGAYLSGMRAAEAILSSD